MVQFERTTAGRAGSRATTSRGLRKPQGFSISPRDRAADQGWSTASSRESREVPGRSSNASRGCKRNPTTIQPRPRRPVEPDPERGRARASHPEARTPTLSAARVPAAGPDRPARARAEPAGAATRSRAGLRVNVESTAIAAAFPGRGRRQAHLLHAPNSLGAGPAQRREPALGDARRGSRGAPAAAASAGLLVGHDQLVRGSAPASSSTQRGPGERPQVPIHFRSTPRAESAITPLAAAAISCAASRPRRVGHQPPTRRRRPSP